jgi:hypothetical protein
MLARPSRRAALAAKDRTTSGRERAMAWMLIPSRSGVEVSQPQRGGHAGVAPVETRNAAQRAALPEVDHRLHSTAVCGAGRYACKARRSSQRSELSPQRADYALTRLGISRPASSGPPVRPVRPVTCPADRAPPAAASRPAVPVALSRGFPYWPGTQSLSVATSCHAIALLGKRGFRG